MYRKLDALSENTPPLEFTPEPLPQNVGLLSEAALNPEKPFTASELLMAKSEMRQYLQLCGLHLGELEAHPEIMSTLQEPQLRQLTSGSGPGLLTAFDGYDVCQRVLNLDRGLEQSDWVAQLSEATQGSRLLEFRGWAQLIAAEQPRLASKEEYTRRRGVEQLVVKTIAWSVGAISDQDYCNELNWRNPYARQKEKAMKLNVETLLKKGKQDPEYLAARADLLEFRQLWGIPSPKSPDGTDNPQREAYSDHTATYPPGCLSEMLTAVQYIGRQPGYVRQYYQSEPVWDNPEIIFGNDFSPPKSKD